jgi:peptidoglycan/LPS O-acetylase OafA/YrhL
MSRYIAKPRLAALMFVAGTAGVLTLAASQASAPMSNNASVDYYADTPYATPVSPSVFSIIASGVANLMRVPSNSNEGWAMLLAAVFALISVFGMVSLFLFWIQQRHVKDFRRKDEKAK